MPYTYRSVIARWCSFGIVAQFIGCGVVPSYPKRRYWETVGGCPYQRLVGKDPALP